MPSRNVWKLASVWLNTERKKHIFFQRVVRKCSVSLAMEETTFLVGKPLSSAQSVPGKKRTWECCGSSQPSREGSSSSWTEASPLSPGRWEVVTVFASLRYPFKKATYRRPVFIFPIRCHGGWSPSPWPRAFFHSLRLESEVLCIYMCQVVVSRAVGLWGSPCFPR